MGAALLVALFSPDWRRPGWFLAIGASVVYIAAGFPLRRIRARIWNEWRELPPIHDDVLGDITPPPDSMEHWLASIDVDGHTVRLELAGHEDGPDASTIEHARQIVQSFAVFEARVAAFLQSETQATSYLDRFAAEIGGLRIELIQLGGRSGMIYFAGGEDDRGWRCDYDEGEPRHLGCDT